MTRLGRLLVVACAAAAISAAGCAPANGLDVAALEASLSISLLPEYPGLVNAVDCPEPLDPVAGDLVSCQAMIGIDPAGIELVFGQEQGVASATITDRLVNATQIEQLVAQRFVDDLALTTTVRCEQPVRVISIDGSVQCTAIDHRGVERGLSITVAADGTLDVDLV